MKQRICVLGSLSASVLAGALVFSRVASSAYCTLPGDLPDSNLNIPSAQDLSCQVNSRFGVRAEAGAYYQGGREHVSLKSGKTAYSQGLNVQGLGIGHCIAQGSAPDNQFVDSPLCDSAPVSRWL